MDHLGRYYTQSAFSNLLVANITIDQPQNVLELGAGGGALLKAASDRWCDADIIATDIDEESIKRISHNLPKVKAFQVDCLKSNHLYKKLAVDIDSIDVAVCNPPYLKVNKIKAFDILFQNAKLSPSHKIPVLTSDVVFLAQNLALLKKNGQLGIIVPDSLVTGHDFAILREALLTNHRVTKIIQLPERIFPKTEALTHIIFIEKGCSSNSYIDLYRSNSSGLCVDHLLIESSQLVNRMDFKYHSHFHKHPSGAIFKTLGELAPVVERGNVENAILKKRRLSQVHTTTLIHKESRLKFKKALSKNACKSFKTASAGDILLARVGRGCIGKVSMVSTGKAIISDCLYKIRVKAKYRKILFNSLASEEGQNWLKAMSHGVCAKVISKQDLLNFPVKITL